MRSPIKALSRKTSKLIRAASGAACAIERLEDRRLLSVSWFVDSNLTLQDTDNAGFPFGSPQTGLIDMSTFDRINVRMGGQSNYVGWIDGYEDWLPLSKPADIDVHANGPAPNSIMFFYTGGSATLSG